MTPIRKHVPPQAPLSPSPEELDLRLEASRWLTQAQRELHDAIFARDGSEESLDRYASARAELDSAEAWALRVTRSLNDR
jgi:hypothetical protein